MPSCEVEVAGRRIKVSLEDLGAAVGAPAAPVAPGAMIYRGAPRDMGGGMKKEKKGKTRKAGRSGKVSGYMKFSQKVRPEVLKDHPELKTDVIGVARKIGEKWRALSQEEKNSYN